MLIEAVRTSDALAWRGRATPPAAPIRQCALVISDDSLMIWALRQLLDEGLGFRTIHELRRVSDIGPTISASRPGLVVIASSFMLDDQTARLIRRLRTKTGPDARLAILAPAAVFSTCDDVLADCLLDDRLNRDEIVEGLMAALRGQRVVKLLASGPTAATEWERLQPLLARLRPRMREVLDLLVCGHSNSQISRLLGVSEPTVKWSVSAILGFFGFARRVDIAAAFARMRALGVF